MFNLFPSFQKPSWMTDTGYTIDGKFYSPVDLMNEFIKLRDLLKSIEEDGTEEHNNAIKLRQENAQLKIDIDNWKNGVIAWRTQYDQEVARNTKLEDKVKELENDVKHWEADSKQWRKLYNEKADYVDELLKEIKNLRHLKEENVRLMVRVNEIDSDQNEKYRAEIFTLKNDIAVLKNRNFEILKMYNGMVTQGGLKYMEAKLQIVQNGYDKCSKERDEYKHQLNAANKEIEALKSKVRDWEDKYAKSFSINDMDKLQKEIDQLKRWKKEQLTVQSWWDKVDNYVRDHDDAPLGGFVANTCLNFLKERDELKAEVEKLKEDIVDYVIEKDDKIEKLQKELNHMKAVAEGAISLCDLSDKTDYDLAMNEIKKTQDWNRLVHGVETENIQKHPMYPIHWGGWDKEEKWQCPCNKCKDKREGKSEKSWEEAASDLALRVAKLEEQLKYTQKIKFKE